ncbi:zinc-binding protein A33-like [Erpetoichthys calabaricus]|uniref:zinc-binding protein A33-like n=1 Tax=Erpetoichthys calabaricus TaxID=27687 RepID=UPI0022341EE5|nr:zinc-binding protein A33-like [Erpetoichthys calabaricus]
MMSPSPEAELAESLANEVTCPICLELYRDPVRLECEHNFCRACISTYWLQGDQAYTCPQCREIFPQLQLKTNRLLANIVQRVRRLRFDSSASPVTNRRESVGSGPVCEKHQEKLKVFCKEEDVAICVVCAVSKEHKDHNMAPIQEVLQSCKESFKAVQEEFGKQKEKMKVMQVKLELENMELQNSAVDLKKHICTEYDELLQFLQAEKELLCSQLQADQTRLEQLRDDQLKKIQENMAEIEEEVKKLQAKFEEEEENDFQVLVKDVKQLSDRLKKGFEEPEPVYEKLNVGLYRGPLQLVAWKKLKSIVKPTPCTLTLDPASANSYLTLSDDLASVRYCYTPQAQLPDDPPTEESRFDFCACVLAKQGFETGKHYWEVEVGAHSDWDIGVAAESAGRDGWIILTPDNGYWTYGHQLCPLVGVYLDYEGGQLTFFDATDMSHLHTHVDASFSEKLYPFFYPSAESTAKPLRLLNPENCSCRKNTQTETTGAF